MAKTALKKYTATTNFIFSQEAYSTFTIEAANDKEALKKIRELVSSRTLRDDADDWGTVDNWFNVSGSFSIARGDEIPDDESDETIVASNEEFEVKKW